MLNWAKEKWTALTAPKQPRAASPADHGGAPLLWCVLLTTVGVAALIGSTWMLLVFVAGSVGHVDWASQYIATETGVTRNTWQFEMNVHWLVGVGLFLFCTAIAIFNATWLEARKHLHGLVRHVVTGIGVMVAVFMISGAIVVQQRGTDARERDRIVAAGAAQVGADAAAGQLESARAELATLMNHENTYMAVAASVGAAEFERSYLSPGALAGETAARVNLLRRSLGAARRADTLRADIASLEGAARTARTEAVATAAPVAAATGWTAELTRFLEDARKPITATLGELLAMTAFGFALASWRTRRAAADAPAAPFGVREDHMVEDLRDQPKRDAEEMIPAREQIIDAETGERLYKRRATYARAPKRKRVAMEFEPEPAKPDEQGVILASDERVARAEPEAIDEPVIVEGPVAAADAEAAPLSDAVADRDAQAVPALEEELTDEELAAIVVEDKPQQTEGPDDEQPNEQELDQEIHASEDDDFYGPRQPLPRARGLPAPQMEDA